LSPKTSRQIGGIGSLGAIVSTPDARDAMARTVIAEAGNQGDSGMAGVVYTILNRLSDGRWGGSVEAVVNAPGQFEPVMRAGGSWRSLRPVTAAQEARVNTIVNLALDGRLPDLTGGARYFQNPQVVAGRARAGTVSSSLVNFGGAPPSAVIGAHAFYVARGPGVSRRRGPVVSVSRGQHPSSPNAIFVGENRAGEFQQAGMMVAGSGDVRRVSTDARDGGGGIFTPD
jgi:spore germination cell wall hydrolase CwlJ-like protein